MNSHSNVLTLIISLFFSDDNKLGLLTSVSDNCSLQLSPSLVVSLGTSSHPETVLNNVPAGHLRLFKELPARGRVGVHAGVLGNTT